MTQTYRMKAADDTGRHHATTDGTVWVVSKGGRYAWPLLGNGSAFGPYDRDCARACGEEVDARLSPGDYRVTNAGPAWREMYETLRKAAE